MKRAPKVEAWVVVVGERVSLHLTTHAAMATKRGVEESRQTLPAEVVRLVPTNPAADAVVKLQRKALACARVLVDALWTNGQTCASGESELRVTLARLDAAVSRLQKARK